MIDWNRALTNKRALIPLKEGEKPRSAAWIAAMYSLVAFVIMSLMIVYANLKAAGV
jgi:hypothetical protein